ncbi:MAG: hypothetical protein R3F37_10370 [Candidatus Competibacteraceae bacterium]
MLGRLNDSLDDYDTHDLEELPPTFSPYLTLVFPHDDWGDRSDDYTTDYRAFALDPEAVTDWEFEIRSDQFNSLR